MLQLTIYLSLKKDMVQLIVFSSTIVLIHLLLITLQPCKPYDYLYIIFIGSWGVSKCSDQTCIVSLSKSTFVKSYSLFLNPENQLISTPLALKTLFFLYYISQNGKRGRFVRTRRNNSIISPWYLMQIEMKIRLILKGRKKRNAREVNKHKQINKKPLDSPFMEIVKRLWDDLGIEGSFSNK